MAPSTDVFNRVRVHTFPQTEHAAYKLAKLVTEQYRNLCKSKLVTMYAAVDALPKEQAQGRPMRLHGTDVGDFDVACLFTGGNEREIWSAIDMAEDLPASCVHYLGGGVNRRNLPAVILDPRGQPLSEVAPDEVEKGNWEEEQRLLDAEVAKNTTHWPIVQPHWIPPTNPPVTPTPSKGSAVAAGGELLPKLRRRHWRHWQAQRRKSNARCCLQLRWFWERVRVAVGVDCLQLVEVCS